MKTYQIYYKGKLVAIISQKCADFARLSFIETNPKHICLEDVKAVEITN